MFTVQAFAGKVMEDFKAEFPEVELGENYIRIGTGITHVELPIASMYKEYQVVDYESVKELYVKVANKVLNQYKFKIDYNDVYPLLKHTGFSSNSKIEFYKKRAFEDLDVLYVADMADVFRFFTVDDDVDFNLLEQKAMKNINRMTAALVPLDKGLQVYTLRYATDYASSLLLSETMNKQIQRKVGDDILIAVPSNSFFIVAEFNYSNERLLEHLIKYDTDPNKVSDGVYRRKDGIYIKVC